MARPGCDACVARVAREGHPGAMVSGRRPRKKSLRRMSKVAPKTASPAGVNRSSGISWTELMSQDARPVPAFLREESYTYRGSEPLAAERYTSPEFMRLEQTKMWPNVWQFAAR